MTVSGRNDSTLERSLILALENLDLHADTFKVQVVDKSRHLVEPSVDTRVTRDFPPHAEDGLACAECSDSCSRAHRGPWGSQEKGHPGAAHGWSGTPH